jgi:integrase
VPVHPDFLGHLKAWYKNDQQQDVHIIRYNGKPIKSIKRSFAHAKKMAGITRRLRPYDFRHAFATWVLGEGADLKSTSEILGHSSTKITTRVYQHTNMAMWREVINKLPVLEVPKIEKKVAAAK